MFFSRYEAIVKVKATQSQLTLMNDIVSKMKKDKDKAMKQVKETEAALQGLITKIRVGVLMCAYRNDPKFSDRQVWEDSEVV